MAARVRMEDLKVNPESLLAWIRTAVDSVTQDPQAYETRHLEELLDGQSPKELVELADLLREVANALPPGWDGRLVLAIPCEETAVMVTEAPDVEVLTRHEFEPPSFYVIGRDRDRTPMPSTELTRIGLRPPAGLEDIEWELMSGRDAYAREAGWDFANTVHMTLGSRWGAQRPE